MRSRWLTGCLLLLAIASPARGSEPELLRIHGSNVLGDELVPALAQAWLRESGFEQAPPRRRAGLVEIDAARGDERLRVQIRSDGSASAFRDLIAGEAEVGMAARPPTTQELEDAWLIGKLRSPDQEFVVALDGLRIVVHPDNPLRALDRAQLKRIFTGQVRDWAQLGGRPGPIVVAGRRPESGTHGLLSQVVLDGGHQASIARTFADNAALLAAVARDPAAIGYLPLAGADPDGVRALAISDGGAALAPSRINALSEDYPLVRRLNFHGAQLMSAYGRSFANFAVSPAGQEVVARRGYLALLPAELDTAPRDGAPAEYSTMLAGAHRLATTLRFGHEYTVLDSRGVQDLDRLAAFMRTPANKDRELMLMSFADAGTGGPASALFLSHDRVDFVADLLRDAGVAITRQRGFGSTDPLRAGAGERTRYVNERIELWVR